MTTIICSCTEQHAERAARVFDLILVPIAMRHGANAAVSELVSVAFYLASHFPLACIVHGSMQSN